jgi:hypothetical protein
MSICRYVRAQRIIKTGRENWWAQKERVCAVRLLDFGFDLSLLRCSDDFRRVACDGVLIP